jgi:hypothetical protein
MFTAVVGLALAANLVLLTPHVVQAAEDGLRARLAVASSGLRTQLELLDAHLAPRGLAQNAELLEVLRPPDPSVPAPRPDERALRAAVAVLSSEPDLLVVANGAGAVVSRRRKAAAALDDLAALGPLRKLVDAASGKPGFVEVDKQLYRVAAARAPSGAGVVLTGALIDDRLAQLLRLQLDADVAFFNGPSLLATSLPPGSRRDDLSRWQKARVPAPGYGKLEVRLPLVGHRFDGELPLGASGVAVRGALLTLDGGVQAAVTVPAGPVLGWFARYQVFYAVALALLFVFGLVWSLLPVGKESSHRPGPDRQKLQSDRPPPTENVEPEVGPIRRRPRSVERGGRGGPAVSGVASLLGADVSPPGEAPSGKLGPNEVPWSPAFEERSQWSPQPGVGAKPARANGAPAESLDPEMAPQAEGGHEFRGSDGTTDAAQAADSSSDPVWASAPASAPSPASKGPYAAPESGHWSDPGPAGAHEQPGGTAQAQTLPGTPGEDLLAQARSGRAQPEGAFPGNEPTRIQPISAALLEKLREKDDVQVPSAFGEGAAHPAADPDEAHFKETFEQFLALREQTGEGKGNVTYEKFAARLRKNREDLLAKHGARGVRFAVYLKEGKAAIKASTTR